MRTSHLRKLRDSQGFTLIELLIVVVIIGILAAIAIPQFSSTKEKAFDATAKSDLRNFITTQEAHFADFQQYGANFSATTSNSTTVQFTPSSGIGTAGFEVAAPNPTLGFQAAAKHPSSTNCFGVSVGDFDNDATTADGSGEPTLGGGSCSSNTSL